MEAKIERSVRDKRTCFIITEPDKLRLALTKAVDVLLREGYRCLYISLNEPHSSVEAMFSKAGIRSDRLYFIDCITAISHKIPHKKAENVEYAENPSHLTAEGKVIRSINQFLASVPGKKMIVIDALRTVLLYNEPALVEKFISEVIENSGEYGAKLVVFTRKDDDQKIVRDISFKFDCIVEI
ncbi:MAG: hypothetical protein V1921_01665 [Candidatus Altiarchaeota archaeon]